MSERVWRFVSIVFELAERDWSQPEVRQRTFPRIPAGVALIVGLAVCLNAFGSSALWPLLFLALLYLLVPLMYWRCSWFRRQIIYMSALPGAGPFCDLKDPRAAGLARARNFYLTTDEGVQLGLWHVWPDDAARSAPLTDGPEEFLDDKVVVFFLRGSIGSRGTAWRVRAIKRLTEAPVDAHVLTLDYRGFGDSTQVKPTVDSVTKDVASVYRWLRVEKMVDSKRIFLLGQSLGSAVATSLVREVQDKAVRGPEEGSKVELGAPAGVILMCPFTSIPEASRFHPLIVRFYGYFPFKETWLTGPSEDPDVCWDNMTAIGDVRAPVLILHAKDDWFVPYSLGRKLFEFGLSVRNQDERPTRMVSYEASLGYAHNRIFCDPGYPGVIRAFMDDFAPAR